MINLNDIKTRIRKFLKLRNNHRLISILVGHIHFMICQFSYILTGKLSLGSRGLRKMGYEILGQLDVSRHDFGFLLDRRPSMGCISLPRDESIEYDAWVFSLVEQMRPKVENALGSYFEIYWYEIQATIPLPESQKGSFLYHSDDTPSAVKKVFVYLTDVSEVSGAFRAFNYEITDYLISKGMLKSSNPGGPREECQRLVTPEIESKLNVLEGKAGTFFVFDNNLIHKGTLPAQGHRIVISFEIGPSFRPITFSKFLEDINSNLDKKFYINPISRKLFTGGL